MKPECRVKAEEEKRRTLNRKPIWRTNAFTSSRSNSIDGSLVLLFSKCHSNGPARQVRTPLEQNETLWHALKKGVRTEIDPNTTRRKDAVDDAKVIHDVLGLGTRTE